MGRGHDHGQRPDLVLQSNRTPHYPVRLFIYGRRSIEKHPVLEGDFKEVVSDQRELSCGAGMVRAPSRILQMTKGSSRVSQSRVEGTVARTTEPGTDVAHLGRACDR